MDPWGAAWLHVAVPTLLLCLAPAAIAQPQAVAQNSEARAAQAFERARHQGPLALYAFLHDMPKGADLHTHLAGAVYAESFIREAAEDNLCVKSKTLTLYKTSATTRSLPPQPVCGEEGERAADALTNQRLYDQLIDVFSMRTFVPTTEESGHDHFFASFDHFLAVEDPRHLGEWVDELASRAASQNEQYLEIMSTPNFRPATAALAESLGPIDSQTDFAHLRQQLLDAGLSKYLPAQRAEFAEGERRRRELEHCGANGATPACNLQVRFLYQVLRALSPQEVFVQLVCGFELASADPLVVGINMVQPEDGRVAMANYQMQMRMVHALHVLYPRVHITLHAGELAPGMVPPDGVRFHIRSAVEEADAERIGHGVDVMYEDRAYDLLQQMAAKRVMVEINLTSNDVILNIKGADHPLPMYRLYHVPVALSTDDEGVSRINLTHEYVRAGAQLPARRQSLGAAGALGNLRPRAPRMSHPTGPRSGFGSMRVPAPGQRESEAAVRARTPVPLFRNFVLTDFNPAGVSLLTEPNRNRTGFLRSHAGLIKLDGFPRFAKAYLGRK
jgi:adenosine deaminase